MSEKYLVWHIQGGLGKNVAATALCKTIKEAYPDRQFILVCSYPEVFLNNPHIDKVYGINSLSYFYETYIKDKDVLVFKHEPYNQTGHILKSRHLLENWANLLEIPYTGQLPELYPNYAQKVTAKKWFRSKPVLILQTGGGPLNSNHYYSWTRDMPEEIASLIVEKYKSSHHIIHVTRPAGYGFPEVERIDKEMPAMELFGMLTVSSKRFLIDSSLQHAACAIRLPSKVFWVGTSPTVFGYSMHENFTPKTPSLRNNLLLSYTFDYQFDNNLHECPYNNIADIFDIDGLTEKL